MPFSVLSLPSYVPGFTPFGWVWSSLSATLTLFGRRLAVVWLITEFRFVSLMGAAPELSRRTVNVSKRGTNGCVTFGCRRWFHDCVFPSFAPDDYYWRLWRHNGTEPSVLLLSGSVRASGPDTIHPQAPASGEFTDKRHHLVNTGLLFRTSAVWDSAPQAAKKLLNLFIYLFNNCR